MNRRKFVASTLGILTAVWFLPKKAWAKVQPKRGFTIGQILHVSYPSVLHVMKDGKMWATKRMQDIHDEGRVIMTTLGPTVESNGKIYDIQQLMIPMMWSDEDERKNPTEREKIELVRQLLMNGISSMDDVLVERIGDKKLVVSDKYRYMMGNITQFADQPMTRVCLWTAYAVID